MHKVVQELDDIFPARSLWIGLNNALQQLDFINRRFGIVRRGFDDLESYMAVLAIG